jgi:hypothetical protein
MSDSDICTTFLLSSWAFITIVSNWDTQFVSSLWKKSLSTFEDCTKNVHSVSLKTDRATEQMNQNVELYICTFSNYSQNNWASLLLMTELVINNHDFVSTEVSSSSCLMSITWSLYNYLRSWSLYDLQKFSTESWSNCTEDERSHRVSTDDYDSHSADTERNSEWKRQQSYDFKKEDKSLTKS